MHEQQTTPEIYNTRIRELLTFYNNGQYNETIHLCTQLIPKFPNKAEPYHLLGIIQAQQNESHKAIELIRTAIRLEPENIPYKVNLANILHEEKHYLDALYILDHALALSPNNVSALDIKGVVLKDIGKIDEAEKVFQLALTISPGSIQVQFNLACTYQNSNRLKKAEDLYCNILAATKTHLKSLVNLAKIYQNDGRLNNAETLYLDALEHATNTNNITLNYNLAVFYSDRERFSDAIKYFKKTLDIDNSYFDAANNLAINYWKIGELKASQAMLQEVNTQDPKTNNSQLNLCMVTQSTQVIDDWSQVIDGVLNRNICNQIETQKLYLDQAIIAWLSSKVITCEKKLKDSIDLILDENKKTLNARAYHCYLSRLVKFWLSNKRLYCRKYDETIYYVGDSHCLTANGLSVTKDNKDFIIRSYLVIGAKAWHLSQTESNQFKVSTACAISKMQKGAYAIFGFGEIDCRVDEGIFAYFLTHRNDCNYNLEESILNLVSKYVNFVVEAAKERELTLIFYGIPASVLTQNISALSDQDRIIFLGVTELYNSALKQFALKVGGSFIDIYAETIDDSGFAKQGCHIDGRHLSPNVFISGFEQPFQDNQ